MNLIARLLDRLTHDVPPPAEEDIPEEIIIGWVNPDGSGEGDWCVVDLPI